MRLYYISPRDVRKNRADPVHIMKSCNEFSKNGFDVTLVTPRVSRKENVKKKEIWSLYNLDKNFKIVELSTYLKDETPSIIVRFQKFAFFLGYYIYLLLFKNLNKNSILYSKCYISILPAILLKKVRILRSKIFFEAAAFVEHKWSHRFNALNNDGIVVFNNYIKLKYLKSYGIPERKIYKANFPSQFEDFSKVIISGKNYRTELGLSRSDSIAMYTGKISPKMKEIHYILEAAKNIPEVKFIFVGLKDDFKSCFYEILSKQNLRNVKFYGFQPLDRFFKYVSCADILLSYYDTDDKLSVNQRASAKAGVYVCAGKPIIFADLPSTREIFSEDMAFFVPPDKPKLLSEKIKYILNDTIEASRKSEKSLKFAKKNTYSKSYKGISDFIKLI